MLAGSQVGRFRETDAWTMTERWEHYEAPFAMAQGKQGEQAGMEFDSSRLRVNIHRREKHILIKMLSTFQRMVENEGRMAIRAGRTASVYAIGRPKERSQGPALQRRGQGTPKSSYGYPSGPSVQKASNTISADEAIAEFDPDLLNRKSQV